jgi:hypothetical protein
MSESVDADLADLSSWQAESLRLTVFPTPKPYSIETWWEKLVGEPPEKTVSQPREGIIREEGPALDGSLSLIVQTTRIDWVLGPIQPPSLLGELPRSAEAFLSQISKWLLGDAPPAQRIAFGLATQLPVPDEAGGYHKLSKYLPGVTIDAENTSEFLYQINRPRASNSGIEGLKINRLARWSVGFIQQATFSMSDGKASATLQQSQFHCRAELDINTAADFGGEFTRQQSEALVRELADLALEIIKKGDIP